ncbi:ribonuclease HI family protein [bacterium]|nr:ribonuclease HI family protein [bacterium]
MEDQLQNLKKLRQELFEDRRPEKKRALDALDWAIKRIAPPIKARLFTDGGARGNPGPAAYGLVLFDTDGGELLRRAKRIGRATNNVAEYRAVIAGLELAGQLNISELDVYLDAQLVVRQLTGEYKTKNPALIKLKGKVLTLTESFNAVRFHHIPREKNLLADSLVNAVLSGRNPDTP